MNNPIITKALKNATNELAVNIPRLKKIILELPVSKSSEINRAKLIKDINNPHKLPIVYATNNHGKAEEILNAFIDIKKSVPIYTLDILGLPDIPKDIETGGTYIENAILKGLAVQIMLKELNINKVCTLGDDAGFEIDKLGGFPGLKSQRWLDEVGNALNKITTRDGSGGGKVTGNQKREATLSLLDDSTGNRKAKFKCTLALIDNTNTVKNISIGDVDLLIASKARGASKQDYDPIIIPVEGDGRTFAEMSTQEKNSFSHRGKAAKKLKIYIDKLKQ